MTAATPIPAPAPAPTVIERRHYDCALDVRDKVKMHFILKADNAPGPHPVNAQAHVADDIESTYPNPDPVLLDYDFGTAGFDAKHEMCVLFRNSAGLAYVFNFDPVKAGARGGTVKSGFYIAHNQCNDTPRANDIVATGTCRVHVSFQSRAAG